MISVNCVWAYKPLSCWVAALTLLSNQLGIIQSVILIHIFLAHHLFGSGILFRGFLSLIGVLTWRLLLIELLITGTQKVLAQEVLILRVLLLVLIELVVLNDLLQALFKIG